MGDDHAHTETKAVLPSNRTVGHTGWRKWFADEPFGNVPDTEDGVLAHLVAFVRVHVRQNSLVLK